MATLKIRFERMFLLVRSDPPVVLLPHGRTHDMPHALYVVGTETPIRVCGADLAICTGAAPDGSGSDCTPLVNGGRKSRWPDGGFVLDANVLVKANAATPKVRGELLTAAACPEELGARLRLPNGSFGWKWNQRPNGTARWQVGPKWNRHQWLTDVMTFECQIADNVLHALHVTPAGSAPLHRALQVEPGDDIDLTVLQFDETRRPATGFGTRTVALDDFRVVLDLFVNGASLDVPKYWGPSDAPSPPGPPPQWPIVGAETIGQCPKAAPAAASAVPRSDTDPERPICGGGQGDPP